MSETCPKCGLPRELCVCESIAKEAQRVRVFLERKKFDKVSTVVEGIDPKSIGIKSIAKKLKARLACGGTVKRGRIELQGDHRQKAKQILQEAGFASDSIEVK